MDIYSVKIRKVASIAINLSSKFLQEWNVFASRDMLETAQANALLSLSLLLVKKINTIMLKVNFASVNQALIKFLESVLRYHNAMLILIGMVRVVLVKLDLLSDQQESVKSVLLQLQFVTNILHGMEKVVFVTLVMLLFLENAKSTFHQIQFVTKTQFGMVRVASVTPVM